MKQSIWRQRSASDVIDQHPNNCRGEKGVLGAARNAISELVRGPVKSNAVAVILNYLVSYTTSASKSKKRLTRVSGSDN
jgi:hypothetical protein